ncbi:hypothetical protein A3Q56_01060 [Intoshia linei]|uniref:Uncharacterized protein n=1 Tax=Intoshia linei TaxID=1819745 RepID=A0A177BAK0_9BILA|nr:hypothetical protein A3Q56_01060 [Intoshia linei]
MSEDLYIENYKKRLKLGARLLKEYDKVKIIDSTTKYKNQFNTKPTISKNVMKSVNLDYFDNFEKIHKQNKKNDKFNTMDGNQSKSKFNRKVNSSSLINDFNNVNNNNNDDYTMNNKNVNKMVITCATQTIPPKKDKKQDKTTRQKFLSNLIKEWVDFNSGKSIKEKKKINVNVDKKKTKTCNKAIDTKCDEMSLKYVENENNLELLNCKNVKELIKSIKDYANPPNINDRYEEIIRNVEGEISKELENLRIEKVANTKLTHVNNKIIEKYVESAVIKKTSLILKEKENLTQKNYNYHVEGKNDSLKQTEISKEIMAQQENVKKMDTSNETSLDEYTEYSSDSFLTDVSDSQTGVIEKDEENFKKIDNMINYSENIKAQSIKIQESSTESYSDTLTGPYSETLQTTESIDSKIRSSISLVNVKIQMNKKKLHSKSENKNCNNCCKRKRYTKSQKIVYIQKTHEEPLNYNLNNIKNFEMKKSMLNHIAKNNSKFPKSIQTDFVEEEKIHEDFIAVENVKPIKIIPIGHQIINLQDEHENFKEPSIETYSSIQSISTCEWLTESVNEGEFSYSSDSTLVPN